MADSQENKQKEQNDVSEKKFMIEKIKERPVNKKKLLRRTLITASMAVIFGLVACFTFLVLEPVISNWLYPEEEPQVVVFPEDQDEMSPEQMLAENMQQENQSSQSSPAPSEVMEQEQIRELLSGIILNLDNYKQIYNALSQYVAEMNRSMVTVTGVSSGVDWFNNVNESKNQSSGVIIAQNGKQLLILTDYSPVKQADDIIVTFNEGTQADASLKEKDETTGLAVIAVELDVLNEDFLKNDITIATLGSSNIRDIAGLPVVALGRPMGINGSLGYGIITSSASESFVPMGRPKATTGSPAISLILEDPKVAIVISFFRKSLFRVSSSTAITARPVVSSFSFKDASAWVPSLNVTIMSSACFTGE